MADPVGWERSVWEEPAGPDGPLSCEVCDATGVGGVEEKPASTWVCFLDPLHILVVFLFIFPLFHFYFFILFSDPVPSTIPAIARSLQDWSKTNHPRFMTDKIMPLSQAVEAYDIFNAMKVQKVIFEADK